MFCGQVGGPDLNRILRYFVVIKVVYIIHRRLFGQLNSVSRQRLYVRRYRL